MARFTPAITVKIEEQINSMTRRTLSEQTHYIDIEAPGFDGALSDTAHISKELLAATMQHYVDTYPSSMFPMAFKLRAMLCGVDVKFSTVISKEKYDQLKKATPEEKELNVESLKTDIQYGINMLRSTYDAAHWMEQPIIVWQYNILAKHFGIPLPKEIQEAQAKQFG